MLKKEEVEIVCNKLFELDIPFRFSSVGMISPMRITILGGQRVKAFIYWLCETFPAERSIQLDVVNDGLQIS